MESTATVRAAVARARRRLRAQAAIEMLATAWVPAVGLALLAVVLRRVEVLTGGQAAGLLAAAGAIVLAGPVAGALRRLPTSVVATRLDRASGLKDRLANACAFDDALRRGAQLPGETEALMRAAVRDGERAAARADAVAAAPIRWPRDGRAAAAFTAAALAVGGLSISATGGGGASGALPAGDPLAAAADEPDRGERFREDDLEYARDLVDELRRTAEEAGDRQLVELADRVDEILDRAADGELTREQMLSQLAEAERAYERSMDPDADRTLSDLQATGQKLRQNEATRGVGEALSAGDLGAAETELEELASELENEEMGDREREELAEALDEAAESFEEREREQDEQREREIEQTREEKRELERRLQREQDEDERRRLERRLQRNERELRRLERERDEDSEQRRRLQRLHRQLREASEDLQRNDQRTASGRVRRAADETRRVQEAIERQRQQQQTRSQLDDLQEALRRARQDQNQGPQDLFGRNQRDEDFRRRAQGQQGQRRVWRPGQSQGQGQGQGQQGQGQQGSQQGGQGTQPGGDSHGDEHDPDLLGDETPRQHDTEEVYVTGEQGEGPSRRETILTAAQRGFANRAYREVYADYRRVVEEVMNAESIPTGYKYYVRRYFQKINPHTED